MQLITRIKTIFIRGQNLYGQVHSRVLRVLLCVKHPHTYVLGMWYVPELSSSHRAQQLGLLFSFYWLCFIFLLFSRSLALNSCPLLRLFFDARSVYFVCNNCRGLAPPPSTDCQLLRNTVLYLYNKPCNSMCTCMVYITIYMYMYMHECEYAVHGLLLL